MSNTKNLERFSDLVGSIRIDHLRFEAVKERLAEAYEDVVGGPGCDSGEGAVPICLLVVGETRTGKSCAIKDFMAQYKPVWSKEGLRRSVVYATIPPEGTVKAILGQLLRALGDPLWASGSKPNMTSRLHTLLQGVGCRMIILDEFQHLCDKGQRALLTQSADWLKSLVEGKEWALVAVGLPESVAV